MNMNNNAAKFDSIVRRNLPSFLGVTMGVLMLMAVAAPSAHAVVTLVTYFNFNDTPNDFLADAGRTPFPTITETVSPPVSGGLFNTSLTYTNPNKSTFNSGTTLNESTVPPSDSAADNLAGHFGAMDINGNTTGGGMICFQFTANTTGLTQISLSFAIASVGTGGQFNTLTLEYSNDGGATFNAITPLVAPTLGGSTLQTDPPAYQLVQANLTSGADNQSSLLIQFCLSGSGTSATQNHTFIDNIQVNSAVPEPSTYIGGLLGIVGVCWYQRRSLTRFLGLRPA